MRVLAVDDSTELLGLLTVLLENAGHEAVTTTLPARAIELAAGQRFALLITDLQMPGMDGVQLQQRIRELPGYHDLPVLLLSGHPLDGLAGGDHLHLLEKPFSLSQFDQALAEVLGGRIGA